MPKTSSTPAGNEPRFTVVPVSWFVPIKRGDPGENNLSSLVNPARHGSISTITSPPAEKIRPPTPFSQVEACADTELLVVIGDFPQSRVRERMKTTKAAMRYELFKPIICSSNIEIPSYLQKVQKPASSRRDGKNPAPTLNY
jgi:hypothetical protein